MVADAPGYWMLNWYHWRMRQNIELESKSKNILIVDSICDTGSTLDHIKKQLYSIANGDEMNYTFAVVDVDPSVIQKVDNYVNVKGPEWLVYPWEFGSQELKL
jgi:hypoxanthine phosphoribosyltransferase